MPICGGANNRVPLVLVLCHFTGVLDWFEVDLSACPASSLRVICVMSIFIISYAHVRGSQQSGTKNNQAGRLLCASPAILG